MIGVTGGFFAISFGFFYRLFFDLHRFLLSLSLEQTLVRLQLFLRYFNNAFSVDACESAFSDFPSLLLFSLYLI